MYWGSLRSDIRKNLITERIVNHWDRLHREGVESPSLGAFKEGVDVEWDWVSSCTSWSWRAFPTLMIPWSAPKVHLQVSIPNFWCFQWWMPHSWGRTIFLLLQWMTLTPSYRNFPRNEAAFLYFRETTDTSCLHSVLLLIIKCILAVLTRHCFQVIK